MTNDPSRPLVLLVDSEALEKLPGLSRDTYSMLKCVGYDEKDIQQHAREGTEFKLVVFKDDGSSLATLGTWDNMIRLATKLFPRVAHILTKYADALKTVPYSDFVQMSGDASWPKLEHTDPKYMNEDRLLANPTVANARRFFNDTLHLRALYAGDGWTRNQSGQKDVKEYVVPNAPLSTLGDHILLDLPKLTLPKLGVSSTTGAKELPIPPFYDPMNAALWAYEPNLSNTLAAARAWKKQYGIKAAATDRKRVCLLVIDAQRDFCQSEGTLFVGGRNGKGAIEDNNRLAQFIYRELPWLTAIKPTMDTHLPFQVFTRAAWLDAAGAVPGPFTIVENADVKNGRFTPEPMFASMLGTDVIWMTNQMLHYTAELEKVGKYKLMLWTEHCVLGQSGHALSGVIQEARMFHAYARGANNEPIIKGGNPLTENYSIVQPEVLTRFDGASIAQKNTHFLEDLLKYDYVLIAGQAASHCVKSSIEDILAFILATSPGLAQKVYVMEDCMSAVVSPAYDYTSEAEAALQLFRSKGMHVVKSTTPMANWPDIQL